MNAQAQAQAVVSEQEMDQYGRTEAERTMVLDSDVAEQINAEVETGEWQAYGDAMNYVLTRGFAEIKRTRDASAKLKLGKAKAQAMDKLSELLSLNPTLVNQPDALRNVLGQLGIKM